MSGVSMSMYYGGSPLDQVTRVIEAWPREKSRNPFYFFHAREPRRGNWPIGRQYASGARNVFGLWTPGLTRAMLFATTFAATRDQLVAGF